MGRKNVSIKSFHGLVDLVLLFNSQSTILNLDNHTKVIL